MRNKILKIAHQKTYQKTFRAKKSFGQNFLKSELALRKIVEAGEIDNKDTILEIGPGKGALTSKLLEKANLVIAVEKDHELFKMLEEKFNSEIKSKKLLLINEDILTFNMQEILLKFFSGPRKQSPDRSKNSKEFPVFKIIANIPYNITGAIFKKFLTATLQPGLMVLMVQHEVAKRILARDKKESILSISVKAYGEPKMIMKVPARYFSPAPKVDSAIVAIRNISRRIFKENLGGGASMDGARHDFAKSEEIFWEIVKLGFSHKRKKLSGNLKTIFSLQELEILGYKDKRAEDLGLSDWILLAKNKIDIRNQGEKI